MSDKNNCKQIYKVITLDVKSDKWYDFSSEMAAWYHSLDKAIFCVETNNCDIQDQVYNYALISSSKEGCYGLYDEELYWFKWNKSLDKWEQIDLDQRPKACKQIHIIG